MSITTLAVGSLLAALVLGADDARQGRPDAGGAGVAQGPGAQPATKGGTGPGPNQELEAPAEQQPGMANEQVIVNPFAPVGSTGAMRIPFSQRGAVRGASRGLPLNRALVMPQSPFQAVPLGSTARRPAAVYGIAVGPAPAVGGGQAFAGYRPPSPISPYMSLYAPPTLGVDNYNAYVRPQLEQQAFNRQVQSAVLGLEAQSAQPTVAPLTFEQIPNLYPVGPGVPAATYMSFQQYYPGGPGPLPGAGSQATMSRSPTTSPTPMIPTVPGMGMY